MAGCLLLPDIEHEIVRCCPMQGRLTSYFACSAAYLDVVGLHFPPPITAQPWSAHTCPPYLILSKLRLS